MSTRDWFEVLERLQTGDRLAVVELTSLITGHLRRSRAYELRDSWSDVAQEVLIKLIRAARAGQIDQRDSFVAFVGTTTRRCMIDWIRKNARYVVPAGTDGDGAVGDDEVLRRVGAVAVDHPDQRVDLEAALEKVSDAQRQVLLAIYVSGQSYQEASEALQMPLGTLKRHQTQGLKAIREKLGLGEPGA